MSPQMADYEQSHSYVPFDVYLQHTEAVVLIVK